MSEPFEKPEEFKGYGPIVPPGRTPFTVKDAQNLLARLKARRATETNAEFTKRLYPGLGVDAAVANGDSK